MVGFGSMVVWGGGVLGAVLWFLWWDVPPRLVGFFFFLLVPFPICLSLVGPRVWGDGDGLCCARSFYGTLGVLPLGMSQVDSFRSNRPCTAYASRY